MSFLRLVIKLSVVIVCAVGSFGGVAGFMAAQSEAAPLPISTPDPIAAKLAEDSDLTGKMRLMSPIYPTAKYTQAQLAVKKPIKAKVATRSANKNKMPMQLAYSGNRQVVARAGAVYANVR